MSATSVIWEGETTIRGIVRHVRLLSDGSTEDWRTVSLGAKEYETWCGGAWWPYVARQIVADLQRAQADLATAYSAIRDIDAHATPYGEGEYAQLYIISAGSLHRALALTGAAAKCATLPCERAEKAERELERANGLLTKLEWNIDKGPDHQDGDWCPSCEHLRKYGHTDDCELAAYLRGEVPPERTRQPASNTELLTLSHRAALEYHAERTEIPHEAYKHGYVDGYRAAETAGGLWSEVPAQPSSPRQPASDTRAQCLKLVEECLADWSYESDVAANVRCVLINLGAQIAGEEAEQWVARVDPGECEPVTARDDEPELRNVMGLGARDDEDTTT